MIRIWPLMLALVLAGPVAGQNDPASMARRAADQLEVAQIALRESERSSDRVRALTQTIRAYESGLVALRDSLRRAAIREAALRRAFDAERRNVSRLLGVLQSIEASPTPLLLLHPGGAAGTVRSGMIVAEITPALQRQATALKTRLEEIALLRALQDSAASSLQDGLAGVQQARTALSQAVSNRTDLPQRLVTDPQAMSALIQSAETLQAFASGLTDLGEGTDLPDLPDLPDFADARGTLPLPVDGTILRRAGEADAAGIARPGLVIATAPRALVTTPWPATIRYRGPLLDYGNVMILEPGNDHLLVLAGLDQVFGEVGQVLPVGTPVGLMGGTEPPVNTFLATMSEGGGERRSETLYMELRQGTTPVDPVIWFAID